MIYLRGDAQKPLGGLYLRSQDSKASGGVTGTIAATASAATSSAAGTVSGSGGSEARIIDHTNFDPASRSLAEIQAAAALKVYFEHASTGQDIVGDSDTDSSAGRNYNDTADCGIHELYDTVNTRYLCDRESFDTSNDYTWFSTHNGLQDNHRGNPTPATKLSGFVGMSANMRAAIDVAMFKFCWIDVWPETDGYVSNGATFAADLIDDIETFEAANPGITHVYWTMPLQSNESYAAREAYNAAIRTYCSANNKWLLDIADIQCHNDSGVKQTDGNGREIMESSYAAADGGHLAQAGRLKLARAYWQLITAIANDGAGIVGSVAATASAGTAAAAGSFTSPGRTGTISATASAGSAAAAGETTPPTFSGAIAASAAAGQAAVAGTATPPGRTGIVAATASPGAAAAAGETEPPSYTGTIAATAAPGAAAAAGAAYPPGITGAVAAIAQVGQASAAGSVAQPEYTGALAAVASAGQSAASGGAYPPGISGQIEANASPATSEAAGTSDPPEYSGAIGAQATSGLAAASGTVTPPSITGTLSATASSGVSAAYGFPGEPVLPDVDRIAIVPAETRTVSLGAESRVAIVGAENRIAIVGQESRVAAVPAESRIIQLAAEGRTVEV